MFRFHHDKDSIDNDTYATETACAKPKDSSPDFTFVKAVQSQVSEQNAKGEGNPLVMFTLCGHKTSFCFCAIQI